MPELLYLLHAGYEVNEDYEMNKKLPRRLIHLVCKTEAGDTRILRVKDWLPYVYVKDISSTGDEDLIREHLGWNVDNFRIVQRVQAVGFSNNKLVYYAKVWLRSWPPYCKDVEFKKRLFENSIKPHSKFYCETGLRSGAWLEVSSNDSDIMLSDLRPRLDENKPPRLTICAYDLETSGLDPNTCRIYQCCCVLWTSTDKVHPDPRSVVICTQPTAVVGDTKLIIVKNEIELIQQLRRLILDNDVDILTGFNLTFDNSFIKRRLQNYTQMALDDLARPAHAKSSFVEKELKTAALGNNVLTLWNIPGRVVIDLFLFSKATYPTLPNHKLNTCGETFIGASKDDVVWGTIVKSFADEAAIDLRGTVAKYCLQDGFLCIQLMDHWSAHISILEVNIDVYCINMSCPCAHLLARLRVIMHKKNISGTIRCSTKTDKKLMLIRDNGKIVHFGLCGSQTFLEGASHAKRTAYRARHSRIILKDGTRAIDKKYSPAYLSYHLLW
jgi:DNA polymerase elongation subunit (family B)